MSLNDILKIALTIIGCFGGVGAIVSATVKFTSEKIAERLEKKYELSLNSWSRASKPLFSRVLRLFSFRIAF